MIADAAPRTVSKRQAAAALGVSTRTIERWIRSGRSPVRPLRVGARWKFNRADIERFLAGQGGMKR